MVTDSTNDGYTYKPGEIYRSILAILETIKRHLDRVNSISNPDRKERGLWLLNRIQ